MENLCGAISCLFTGQLKRFSLYHFRDLKGFTLIYNRYIMLTTKVIKGQSEHEHSIVYFAQC